jgi:glycosyltransferase involved in cell wall biosynthesis
MACGKPVIATVAGGNIEMIDSERTGFLVPVNSPSQIAAAADKLVANRDLRLTMGAEGRRRVEREFSLERMVTRYEQLYLELWHQEGQAK